MILWLSVIGFGLCGIYLQVANYFELRARTKEAARAVLQALIDSDRPRDTDELIVLSGLPTTRRNVNLVISVIGWGIQTGKIERVAGDRYRISQAGWADIERTARRG